MGKLFRRFRSIICLLSCLSKKAVSSEGSRSLEPIKSRTAVEFQANEYLVGLLDNNRRGGIQVVHVPTRGNAIEGQHGVLADKSNKKKKKAVSHIKASILTVSLFGLLLRNLVISKEHQHGGSSWGPVLFVGLLYLLEAFFCSTRRYLSNVMEPRDVIEYVESLQRTAPKVRWDVECFHYRDEGFSSRRRHDSAPTKVVTHKAHQDFWFQQWRDVTKTDRLKDFLQYTPQREPYVKVTLLKMILFADNAYYQNYLAQQASFIVQHGNRDFYTDSSTSIEVDGHAPKLLAVRTVIGVVGSIQLHFFWLCTLLGFTVPYRMWFSQHCNEIDVILTKEVTT